MKLNAAAGNFRIVSPDELTSNRWDAVLEVTSRMSSALILDTDSHVSSDGRVLEMLSEHQCQGWLEGYLLTGRHGFFSCYEAFIHIVDSMFNQHAKWLKTCNHIPWRRPIASLNYLLTSHVWRQDHNGFSHQDPGFIDHVVNKTPEVIRVYLPPDANTLLSVTDHCLRSRNLVNVIVAGKQPQPQWLAMDEAIKHCSTGVGIWTWASNDAGRTPDVVIACAGDVPTLEALAAVQLLRDWLPELKVRFVNVVDLMTLQPPREHPHGLSDEEFDALFTADRPIIFAFHGYPWLIHRLTYRRHGHDNLHVRGYKEQGTTTTPFDMTVLNDLDRFHLVEAVLDRTPGLREKTSHLRQRVRDKLVEHREYITRYGEDLPEIRELVVAGPLLTHCGETTCEPQRADRGERPAAEDDDLERPEIVRGGVNGRLEHDARHDEADNARGHERRDSPTTLPLPCAPHRDDDPRDPERKHEQHESAHESDVAAGHRLVRPALGLGTHPCVLGRLQLIDPPRPRLVGNICPRPLKRDRRPRELPFAVRITASGADADLVHGSGLGEREPTQRLAGALVAGGGVRHRLRYFPAVAERTRPERDRLIAAIGDQHMQRAVAAERGVGGGVHRLDRGVRIGLRYGHAGQQQCGDQRPADAHLADRFTVLAACSIRSATALALET